MRVLVTGAAGFIGHHLTRALRRRGYAVLPVDDLRVPPLLDPPAGLLALDVAGLTAAQVRGIDGIFHLAAWRSVPDSFRHPRRYEENVSASSALFDLARRAGIGRLVLASSCEVYGIARRIPTPEHAPLAPRSPYAIAKAAVERQALARRGDLDVRIARLFNVYGPGHRPDTLIASFCRSALTDGRLLVEAPGTQRRDFSYVDSTVARLVRMYELPACPAVLNLGSGSSASVLEVARLVGREVPHARLARVAGRPGEIPEFRADPTLADSVLGPAPHVPLDAGITQTLAWWRRSLEATCTCSSSGMRSAAPVPAITTTSA